MSSLSNTSYSFDNNVTGQNSTFSSRYGGRVSFSRLGKHPYSCLISVYGEYLFNNYSKTYGLNVENLGYDNYNKVLNFKVTDYVLALRYVYFFGNYYEYPFYADLGVSLSNVTSLIENNSVENNLLNTNNTDYSPLNNYNSDIKAIVFGFGIYKKLVNVGLRFYFGIDDYFNGSYNFTQDGFYNNPTINPEYSQTYSTYLPAQNFSAELKIELNLALFSIQRACRGISVLPFAFPIRPRTYWR